MTPSEFWLSKVKEARERPWNTPQIKAAVVILAVIGIALILWPVVPGSSPSPTPSATPGEQVSQGAPVPNAAALEKELSSTLSRISGVGAVQAKLTLGSEGSRVYARNERVETRQTKEKDNNGTTRDITEESADSQLALSNNAPVLEESIRPEVVGVLVIAEGAVDPAVEENLSQAVTGLLGIPASRVTILPMEKGGAAQ